MKTSLQRRSVSLASAAVVSLLVMVTGVQAAQARFVASRASVNPYSQLQLPTRAQIAQHQGGAVRSVAASPLTPSQEIANAEAHSHAIHEGIGYVPGATAPQSASSGISATTVWIVAVLVVAAALLVVAWPLVRRRRRRAELATFCAQHPEDARCVTA